MRPPPQHTRGYAIVGKASRGTKGIARYASPFVPGGASRHRFPWAAPPPRLARTGTGSPCRQPCASAGLRGRRCFSGAEGHAVRRLCTRHLDGDRASIRVWGSPGRVPLLRESADATDCRRRSALDSGKTAKKPLVGVVCLLTIGVLISVGRSAPLSCNNAWQQLLPPCLSQPWNRCDVSCL